MKECLEACVQGRNRNSIVSLCGTLSNVPKFGESARRLFKRQSAGMRSYLDRVRTDVLWTCAFVQQRGKNSCACTLVRFGLALFTSELASCRFHTKIPDFCTHRLCCVPTLLPNDAANVLELRMGGKLADASASKWACALVSAARCKCRFCIMQSHGMQANSDGDA